MRDYWAATRHPWTCLVFVLPLLVVYEGSLYLFGPTPPEQLRNGADVWLRLALGSLDVSPIFGAPLCVVAVLLAWALVFRGPRPEDYVSAWAGMLVESALFAAALYGLCCGLWPLLHALPAMSASALATGAMSAPEPAVQRIVRYLGAGIYEETLFRLLLFSALLGALHFAELPRLWCLVLAAAASALVFAGAHHLGPGGEAFHPYVFLFRTLAGAYFAWIFCLRGFGIAVGAHSGYDVLVGVLL